jgi:hypothetical protein
VGGLPSDTAEFVTPIRLRARQGVPYYEGQRSCRPLIEKGSKTMQSNKVFALWPILPFGAENQPDGSNEGNGNSQGNPAIQSNQSEGQGNSPSNNSGNSQGNPGVSTSDDDDDPYAGLSAKELRRILRDTESSKSATESEKKELEKQIREAEDAKLSKEQKLENDLKTEREANATLRAVNAKLVILGAIRDDSRYEWHNPEVVAQQLNSSVVKVTDDGKVEGIAKELARIAKDHGYLLKSKVDQQNSNNQNDNSGNGPTGFQPGQGGANQGGTLGPNASELAKNYPALANRM